MGAQPGPDTHASSRVVALTQDDFVPYLRAHALVIIEFTATRCPDCARFAPTFARAATRHPEIAFARVDTDQEQELARQLQIRSIPTVIAIRETRAIGRKHGVIQGVHLDALAAALKS